MPNIAVKLYHIHSVCYIAGELVKKLKQQHPKLVDDKDVLCVQIAALCHDLGEYNAVYTSCNLHLMVRLSCFHCELLPLCLLFASSFSKTY